MEPESRFSSSSVSHPEESYKPPSATSVPSTGIKGDHIKLLFPTYGKPNDDPNPLNYLSKCQDFLALQPLSDSDLLATIRTVLYGTARDWWEIAKSQVTTWKEFESAFQSAFLAGDYEDKLAERVRNRKQGREESIRDFAFSYRAQCRRWNSSLPGLQ